MSEETTHTLGSGTISRVGDEVIIRIPISQVQNLRVALQECPCKSNKTSAGIALRRRMVQGLGRVLFNRQRQKEV